MVLAITPDDEMYVIPASRVAGTRSHPMISPSASPGVALRTASSAPAVVDARRASTSSRVEYSRPSVNRRRISPISAPASMNPSAVTNGATPPSPKASPANR
jgi:hypothetical protein